MRQGACNDANAAEWPQRRRGNRRRRLVGLLCKRRRRTRDLSCVAGDYQPNQPYLHIAYVPVTYVYVYVARATYLVYLFEVWEVLSTPRRTVNL
jgi:hypothetical protein